MENENENKEKVKDFLKFQIRRNVTNLFKGFLLILEDLQDENISFSDHVYQKYRKRILDDANDKLREIEDTLNNLEIGFKK